MKAFRLHGEVAGKDVDHHLEGEIVTVGSDPCNQVVLDLQGVSRRHAILVFGPGAVRVVDLNSKNGVHLGGEPVMESEVSIGESIGFGPVELRLDSLHIDDVALAVQFDDEESSVLSPETRPETAEAVSPRSESGTSEWLDLVRRFVAELATDSSAGLARALALVTQGLGVESALLAAYREHGSAEVLSAFGPPGDALDLDSRPGTVRVDRDGGAFSTDSRSTAYSADLGRETIALWLLGPFPGREESGPLLRTLLRAIRSYRPELVSPGREEGGDPPRLRFPTDYVTSASSAMQAVYSQMSWLSRGDLPVLLSGETGVGKELLARTLHLSSDRGGRPFVAINCAAIPADLLEAELFGIADRIATGVSGRKGVFFRANGGTLFLDEIGEMPVDLQPKLLRVLQEKQVQPLGASPVDIDVRVLAATNADVLADVEEGRFRSDLYYRLAGSVLEIPPLRARPDDIQLLVEHFVARFSESHPKRIRGITVRAMKALYAYAWPGNVRQLEHEARRLVYACPPGKAISWRMLASAIRGESDPRPVTGETALGGLLARGVIELEALEREAIRQALQRTDGNRVQAAKLLGISRHGLRRRLEKYDVGPNPDAPNARD